MENQKISLPPPSPTAYDDAFRTMLNDCTGLIIPVVNLYFNENYTGNEEISFSKNEHYLAHNDSTEDKRVTDSSFVITRADKTKKRYHIECEEQLDGSILIRMFEYDAQIALDDRTIDRAEMTVSFPHSAVLALRYTNSAPDNMKINVVTPGGKTSYTVPIIKVQQYSLDELFEKKLLFFLPFYIFNLEKELPECDADEAKLEQLKDIYRSIRARLDELQKSGEIDAFEKNSICSMSNHVMALIAQKYQNVREGVEPIMGGKIIEYEAKTILNKGIEQGIEQGRPESAISTLKRYIRRKLPIDAQVLADIAEDNKLTVDKVRTIAKDNGISLSC
ncbi:MAG: hypothetical protein II178_03095 [Selenomonadaceae bacterium]|nr:hypothetical protein [Selenomonadaceae bacterium]